MANAYNTKDIIKGALTFSGEKTDGTSPYQQAALKFVNDVYSGLLSGGTEFAPEIGDVWSWALQSMTWTQPGYYEGQMNITQYTTSGVFTAVPMFNSQNISLEGYNLHHQNGNGKEWYLITEHTAGSVNFTIDAQWLEDGGSNLHYRAAPLTHNLGPGILRICNPLRIDKDRILLPGEDYRNQGCIYALTIQEFWNQWPLYQVQNDIPARFTTISRSENEWLIRFNMYTKHPLNITCDYIAIPEALTDSTTSIPLIPFQWRSILEMGAAYYLNSQKNQEEKAKKYFGLAQGKIMAMHLADEQQISRQSVRFGQITPRRDINSLPWWITRR